MKLPRGLRLEIKVEPSALAEPPVWSPPEGCHRNGAHRAGRRRPGPHEPDPAPRVVSEARAPDSCRGRAPGSLQCQFLAPATPDLRGDLIAFRSITTRPRPSIVDQPLFSFPIDRPVCRLVDCVLITGGRALAGRAGPWVGRTFAVRRCRRSDGDRAYARKGRETSVRGRSRARPLHADIGTNDHPDGRVARPRTWAGPPLADHFAKLRLSDRVTASPRETVLLRCDADALASGTVFWQANDDAADVDWFVAVGEGPPPSNRARDVQHSMGPVLGAQPHRSRHRAPTAPEARRACVSVSGYGLGMLSNPTT